ncbi:SDR family NAD(P)-dependent oxidoreductase [Sulfobacillus harzensis]|uniref:SDR family NAD(P)-dependent oxidoreductase n=1 Tax=Sulfobacillus harzensis TaxID=2729629 RepID=A0A7Y0L0N7_9FIRM|nr:SDR family NAD(P)-dependent oxidoreductase [Sulfobacillus harzensis]NMP21117.1 SDR family NAD(P)-dependent oxidoreductase [Sulfobacillus harzensis]
MTNVLVLGGTGMLRGLVLRLLEEPNEVFVLARRPEGLRALSEEAQAAAERLTPMALDYHDLDRLGHWVAHVQLMHGPIDQVVAWVAGDRNQVLSVVDTEIYRYRHSPWDLFDIHGSRAAMEPRPVPQLHDNCRYHRVILGFRVEAEGSRWLSHQEIVDGVWRAMAHPEKETIVGQVLPVDLRPPSD